MPEQSEKLCCIVDAYSSGSLLAKEFARYGLGAIHVQSLKKPHEAVLKRYRPRDFITNIVHDGDLDATLSEIKKYKPLFLLAGSEGGVSLADQLRHKLNLFPNDISVTRARRNKYEMIERVRGAGLAAANQMMSRNLQEILSWVASRNEWPVVVLKPLEGAGTENIYICHNDEELKNAFLNTIDKWNYMGVLNDKVLVQEFLKGEEYIVNTVSWEGVHYLSDIWRIAKVEIPGAGRFYDYAELLSPAGEPQTSIVNYVFQVLDALKIAYGPAHNEIMLTGRGPVLVETGARLDGCNLYNNEKYIKCLERHHVEFTAEAYAEPAKFLKRTKEANRVYKYALEVYMISKNEGRLKQYRGISEIEKLASFWEIQLRVRPGEHLIKTIDLMTLPCIVWLAHEDKKVLFDDYRKIRKLEDAGFYDIES